jgi:hypothetical protein
VVDLVVGPGIKKKLAQRDGCEDHRIEGVTFCDLDAPCANGQIKESLATKALAIANAAPQWLLGLFKN